MFLSKKKRLKAEQLAKDNFERAATFCSADFGSSEPREFCDKQRKLAERWTREDIEALRVGFGQEYGSILATLFISLMLKLAMKLIERWAEKKIKELLNL